jgi:hypothetical protein
VNVSLSTRMVVLYAHVSINRAAVWWKTLIAEIFSDVISTLAEGSWLSIEYEAMRLDSMRLILARCSESAVMLKLWEPDIMRKFMNKVGAPLLSLTLSEHHHTAWISVPSRLASRRCHCIGTHNINHRRKCMAQYCSPDLEHAVLARNSALLAI